MWLRNLCLSLSKGGKATPDNATDPLPRPTSRRSHRAAIGYTGGEHSVGERFCEYSPPLQWDSLVLKRRQMDTLPGSQPDNSPEPAERRVLVVEDEAIVAMILAAGLRNDGWEVIGPAANLEEAYELLAAETAPDIAILDLNLDGESIYPLATHLEAQAIPFVFYSGYSAPSIEPRFQDVPRINKPARAEVIDGELSRLLARTGGGNR